MLAASVFAALIGWLPAMAAECSRLERSGTSYVACAVDPEADDVRIYLNGSDGEPFHQFGRLSASVSAGGERLVLAMNGGMFHRDRTPVGLYVEGGEELAPANTRPGPGNFHMLPNGVFYVAESAGRRVAGVASTDDFLERVGADAVNYATQSGPMLVVDGMLHPRFIPGSDSLKRRNGVGLRADGVVVFAISDQPVSFHDFALTFRDALGTPNALYLDGTISRLYAPSIGRDDPGVAMGPIIAVVAPAGAN